MAELETYARCATNTTSLSNAVCITMMRAMTKFREFREKAGLTQEDLAKKLKVSIFTVRSWDQGHRSPQRDRLLEVAKFLKCDVVELL